MFSHVMQLLQTLTTAEQEGNPLESYSEEYVQRDTAFEH